MTALLSGMSPAGAPPPAGNHKTTPHFKEKGTDPHENQTKDLAYLHAGGTNGSRLCFHRLCGRSLRHTGRKPFGGRSGTALFPSGGQHRDPETPPSQETRRSGRRGWHGVFRRRQWDLKRPPPHETCSRRRRRQYLRRQHRDPETPPSQETRRSGRRRWNGIFRRWDEDPKTLSSQEARSGRGRGQHGCFRRGSCSPLKTASAAFGCSDRRKLCRKAECLSRRDLRDPLFDERIPQVPFFFEKKRCKRAEIVYNKAIP